MGSLRPTVTSLWATSVRSQLASPLPTSSGVTPMSTRSSRLSLRRSRLSVPSKRLASKTSLLRSQMPSAGTKCERDALTMYDRVFSSIIFDHTVDNHVRTSLHRLQKLGYLSYTRDLYLYHDCSRPHVRRCQMLQP